jgi:hypothetical protein
MSAFLAFRVSVYFQGRLSPRQCKPPSLSSCTDRGHSGADTHLPAALTISEGKIHQIAAGSRSNAAPLKMFAFAPIRTRGYLRSVLGQGYGMSGYAKQAGERAWAHNPELCAHAAADSQRGLIKKV